MYQDYLWHEEGYGHIELHELIYILEIRKLESELFALVLRGAELSTRIYECIGFVLQDIRYITSRNKETVYII